MQGEIRAPYGIVRSIIRRILDYPGDLGAPDDADRAPRGAGTVKLIGDGRPGSGDPAGRTGDSAGAATPVTSAEVWKVWSGRLDTAWPGGDRGGGGRGC